MTNCTISGRPASLDAAVAAAARLLDDSGAPLIAGLGADYAGVAAAITLARRLDAAFDHMHAEALLADCAARADGWIGTTPLLAHADADVALLIGPGARIGVGHLPRCVVALGGAEIPPGGAGAGPNGLIVSSGREDMAVTLGLLRAVLAGRPVTLAPGRRAALEEAADVLRAARYGVAIWQGGTLAAPAVAQAVGLVADLNAATRFAALPTPPPDNATGAALAAVALCGAPARGAFLGGRATWQPWRPDAATLVADGEADATLWISALSPTAPPWLGGTAVPTIALVPSGTRLRARPDVLIEVGVPGVDHPAVLYDAALGQLAAHPATTPEEPADAAPSVAAVLTRITEALAC